MELALPRTLEEQVFARLDRQTVGEGAESWVTSVIGVYVESSFVWVQVGRSDRPSDTVIVRMRANTPAVDVLGRLACAPQEAGVPLVVAI